MIGIIEIVAILILAALLGIAGFFAGWAFLNFLLYFLPFIVGGIGILCFMGGQPIPGIICIVASVPTFFLVQFILRKTGRTPW